MSDRYLIQPYGFYNREPFQGKPEWYQCYVMLVEMAEYASNPRRYAVGRAWKLERGQLATSLARLQQKFAGLKLTIQNIRTLLKHLKKAGLIHIHSYTSGMIITICYYDKYHQRLHKRQQAMPTQVSNQPSNVYNKQEENKNGFIPTHYAGRKLNEQERGSLYNLRRTQKNAGVPIGELLNFEVR